MFRFIFIFILFTFNLSARSIFDDVFEYSSKQQINLENKDIDIIGTWLSDSNQLLEFIEEDGYYLGIVKNDINDENSVFLNGECIIRFKKNDNSISDARIKYLDKSSYKEWKDANIKLINNTIYDGSNSYKKVFSDNLDSSKLKKKRLNERNKKIRTQALKQIKSTDKKQRLEGLKVLDNLEDRSTIPQIIPLLFDKNEEIKNTSHKLLFRMNKKKEIKGLKDLLKKLDKKEKTVSLYGYWKDNTKDLTLFIAKNSAMEIIFKDKREMGIHIENNDEIALQLTTGVQLSIKYKIEGDILILSFPNKKELFLKKDKEQ